MTISPWNDLEERSAAALALSRDLLTRLEEGADAVDLVPLLTREKEAVADVVERIGRLTSGADAPAPADRRDTVAAHLRELLEVDGRSRDLLTRRGVRLRAPRGRRSFGRAGGTARP